MTDLLPSLYVGTTNFTSFSGRLNIKKPRILDIAVNVDDQSLILTAKAKSSKGSQIPFFFTFKDILVIDNEKITISNVAINLGLKIEFGEFHEIGRIWNDNEGEVEVEGKVLNFDGSVYTLPNDIDFSKCCFAIRVNIFTEFGIINLRFPQPEKENGIYGPWSEFWLPQ